MHPRLILVAVLVAPALAGCAILGPGAHYDATVETEAVGHVLAQGTPASSAAIFLSLTRADAEEPIPENRTVEAGPTDPGAVLELPANASKSVHRLPLDANGEVVFRVPVHQDVVATLRIVESSPPFHISEKECPSPQRLRSSLTRQRLGGDVTIALPFFVVCGQQ